MSTAYLLWLHPVLSLLIVTVDSRRVYCIFTVATPKTQPVDSDLIQHVYCIFTVATPNSQPVDSELIQHVYCIFTVATPITQPVDSDS